MRLDWLKPSNWFRGTEAQEAAPARGKSQWKINNPDPVRHDCRRNGWGHSIHLENDRRFVIEQGVDAGVYYPVSGHLSPRVRPGDEVIVQFGRGPVVVQFVEARNMNNPADMFFGTVRALGYLKDLEQKPVTHELAESALIALEGRTRESHPEQWARGNGVQR